MVVIAGPVLGHGELVLILLPRAGQRIGDWSPVAGRHGILGMELEAQSRFKTALSISFDCPVAASRKLSSGVYTGVCIPKSSGSRRL